MSRVTIGIDNGASGSLGIFPDDDKPYFGPVPVQDYLHYGKKGSIGKRLDREQFSAVIQLILCAVRTGGVEGPPVRPTVRVFVERPFSGKFINTVVPAHRFFEATIIALEDMKLGYEVVDSQVWQRPVLGNVKGSAELKLASKLRGIQLYPELKDDIEKHGDADGLLIGHYFHNRNRRA